MQACIFKHSMRLRATWLLHAVAKCRCLQESNTTNSTLQVTGVRFRFLRVETKHGLCLYFGARIIDSDDIGNCIYERCIEGLLGNRACNKNLSIENVNPVFTSAFRMCTSLIMNSVNNCEASVLANTTTFKVFEFENKD